MEYVYECQMPLMTPDFCKHVIDRFEKNANKSVGVMGAEHRVDTTVKNTLELYINPDSDNWRHVSAHLMQVLVDGYRRYVAHLISNVHDGNSKVMDILFNPFEPTMFKIQKYDVGGYFRWHVDDAYMIKRKVAYIIYLNTLSEGDGGKTKFWKGKNIQPEEGKILFFPATWTYTHSGEEIKKGCKYIITGFMEEVLPPELEEKRRDLLNNMRDNRYVV